MLQISYSTTMNTINLPPRWSAEVKRR